MSDQAKEQVNKILANNGILYQATYAGHLSHVNGEPWDCYAWEIVLTSDAGESEAFSYHMGLGARNEEPGAADVLYCLIADMDGADGVTFDEWCSEYGFDNDSRRAERTYNECKTDGERLRRVISRPEVMDALRDALRNF